MESLYVDARKYLYPSWFIPGEKESGVAFMGDFQYNPMEPMDSDMVRVRKWFEWCAAHKFRILLTGDIIDSCSPSSRQELNVAFVRAYGHSRDALDMGIKSICDKFLEIAEPAIGFVDGGVYGHHGWIFKDGTSSHQYIMDRLGGRNLGDSAKVTYAFGDGVLARVWLHHGAGGAVTPGGILAKGQRQAERRFADLYVYGHNHQNVAYKLPWMTDRVVGKKVVEIGSTRRIMAVGGSLRGYPVGRRNAFGEPEDNYVGKAMLPPVSLGWGVAFFRPMYKEKRLDANVSM